MRKQCLMLLALLAVASFLACSNKQTADKAETEQTADSLKTNAIYHWKTTFNPSDEELEFLQKHDVRRLYVKMFDVAEEYDPIEKTHSAVPIATTRFLRPIPERVEVVPVAFITIEALNLMEAELEEYAELITERLLAMANYNKCGNVREIQLDCDWTSGTEEAYFRLCQLVSERLKKTGKQLSITLRLHQIGSAVPPADRAVLMLYNTGALKNPETRNSILDINDVKPYLNKETCQYAIPVDYAYPAFSWGVKFKGKAFDCIVSNPDSIILKNGEHIRKETVTAKEILDVKGLVEEKLGKPNRSNILYHLDSKSLNKYSDNEIAEIYSYR